MAKVKFDPGNGAMTGKIPTRWEAVGIENGRKKFRYGGKFSSGGKKKRSSGA
jgi:hypothetical protein